MGSTHVGAPKRGEQESGSMWAAVQRLETLFKVLGAGAILVLALGTPAVVFQYKAIGLPVQFITHEEVIRAGTLPSLTIGLVGGLAYVILRKRADQQITVLSNLRQARLVNVATFAVIVNLAIVWALLSAYLLRKWDLEYEPTLRASLQVSWKVRLLLLTTAVPFVFIGRPIVRAVRRFFRQVDTPEGHRRANVFIAISMTLSIFLTWIARRVVMPGTVAESFIDALAGALFFGFYMILISLAVDIQSGLSDDDRKTGIKQFVLVVVLMYCSAVLFYSLSWYSRLPHYLGGGKPVPVTIWVSKAAMPDPSLLGCAAANGAFARCESVYLISVDADYYILTADITPRSRGVVLPRTAVGLISGRQ